MASRQAFCNMLKIDPTLPDEVKDAIISAYQKGITVGQKRAVKDARRQVLSELHEVLGFNDTDIGASL